MLWNQRGRIGSNAPKLTLVFKDGVWYLTIVITIFRERSPHEKQSAYAYNAKSSPHLGATYRDRSCWELTLNTCHLASDYDGPTQLAIDNSQKPAQNSYRYVDATLTIPKGSLYSCCGMNLAFNRELVGPSMYFGLMGHVRNIRKL